MVVCAQYSKLNVKLTMNTKISITMIINVRYTIHFKLNFIDIFISIINVCKRTYYDDLNDYTNKAGYSCTLYFQKNCNYQ